MTANTSRTTVRYRDLFRDLEFSGLYIADVLTMTGTYLARLAVAVLVYRRTESVGLTAAAFAISFAPYLFAPWLSTLADRLPRKHLLVIADLLRAALVVVLLIPGVPLPLLLGVLFVLELIQIPFGAARLATLADVLDAERFPVGNALVASTRQALQVGGFLVGGVLVAATSPQVALVVDIATYALSGLLIWLTVKHRPLPWTPANPAPRMWKGAIEGFVVVRRIPGMTQLFLLLGLGPGLIVVAEGLAVPYVDQLGSGTAMAGVMMAAAPIGNIVGFAIAGRLTLDRQRSLVYPLAAAAGLLVAGAGLAGDLLGAAAPVVGILVFAGASLAYLNAIQAEIATVVPREARGRVFGLANAVMMIFQGLCVALAGVLAEARSISVVLIVIGTAGIGAVGILVWLARGSREAGQTVSALSSRDAGE